MNKTILMGRLTRNPELKQTITGKSVTTFTLAVNRIGKDKKADFFNIVTWNKTAEFCATHFSKGQQVAVVGRLQNNMQEMSDGKKRYFSEIHANEVYFAGANRLSDSECEVYNEEDVPEEILF